MQDSAAQTIYNPWPITFAWGMFNPEYTAAMYAFSTLRLAIAIRF